MNKFSDQNVKIDTNKFIGTILQENFDNIGLVLGRQFERFSIDRRFSQVLELNQYLPYPVVIATVFRIPTLLQSQVLRIDGTNLKGLEGSFF